MAGTTWAPWQALALLVGCAGGPETIERLPPELREVTVVAVLEPGAAIPETSTFSWMPGSFVRLDARYDADRVEREVLTILEEALRRRGYYLVPGGRGDLWIGYAIAVESALDGADLDAIYGFQRRPSGHAHERGALVLDIVDRDRRMPLWRGSAAILTDPSLSETLRRQRVEFGVERLLDRLKAGY